MEEIQEDWIPVLSYREYLKENQIQRLPRKQKKEYKKSYKEFLNPEVIAYLKIIRNKPLRELLEENRIWNRHALYMNCLSRFLNK